MIRWLKSPDDPLPDAECALPRTSDIPGLVAAGGELTARRLAEAYGKGIFPWYSDGQPILWWSPDPRMVLLPAEFKPSRSLRKTLRRFIASPGCVLRIDSATRRVIVACASVPRGGESGTWIVPEMVEAYGRWHDLGRVHSFETWTCGELTGGLYGVSLGRMFFGESMFTRVSDASKVAFVALARTLGAWGFHIIDAQVATHHTLALGAEEWPRPRFLAMLKEELAAAPTRQGTWSSETPVV